MTPRRWVTLEEKVVLVTGASSGIGRAVSLRLLGEGCWVSLAGRRAGPMEELGGSGVAERRLILTGDVTEPACVRTMIERTVARFGRLDAVILNAGVGSFCPVEELLDVDLERLVATNLVAVIRGVRESLAHLRRTGGRIVLVASGAGRRGHPGMAVYSATKSALYGFADALRVELMRDGVRTTVIAPRATRTGFFANASGTAPPVPVGADEPDVVADAVVRALRTAPATIDLRRGGRLRAAMNALWPSLYDRYLARRVTWSR